MSVILHDRVRGTLKEPLEPMVESEPRRIVFTRVVSFNAIRGEDPLKERLLSGVAVAHAGGCAKAAK